MIKFNVKEINKPVPSAVERLRRLESERLRILKENREILERQNIVYHNFRLRKVERSLKFSRWIVCDDYTGTDRIKTIVAHESGHSILFRKIEEQAAKLQYPIMKRTTAFKSVNETMKKARKTGDIYKISEYGNTNYQEFFAESFAMYRRRKSELPQYIIEMIEGVIK